jgi:hypothetical protein
MNMRTNYAEWLINRTLVECNNQLIVEVGEDSIPELEIRIKDLRQIGNELMLHYQKEVLIQQPYGGIRNPPMVLCNKMRHEFTNYDHIRDSMTDAVRSGDLDKCRELELRMILTKKVKDIVDALINVVPVKISVSKQTVERNQLRQANERYSVRELGDIQVAMGQCRK